MKNIMMISLLSLVLLCGCNEEDQEEKAQKKANIERIKKDYAKRGAVKLDPKEAQKFMDKK